MEVLEHRRDARTQVLQLLRVGGAQLAALARLQPQLLAGEHDAPGVRLFEQSMQRSSVLLPESLEPMIATTSPACAVRLAPFSTSTLPKHFVQVFDAQLLDGRIGTHQSLDNLPLRTVTAPATFARLRPARV